MPVFAVIDLTVAASTIVGALIASSVAFYLARANKEGIVAASAKASVEASSDAVALVRGEIDRLMSDLVQSRERIAVLESQNMRLAEEGRENLRIAQECRLRIQHLTAAIRRLGGTVDDGGDVKDSADG